MITINAGNVWANVPPGSARFQAGNILRYRPKGYIFSPKYKVGQWDGYVRLMTKAGNFPAGLAPYLVSRLAQAGQSARIERDGYPLPPNPLIRQATLLVQPRPDQQQAVDSANQPPYRGVIHYPTGTGKTIIMATLVYSIAVPALILCHRKDLMHQLYKRMCESMDIPALIGMVGDGREDWNWITVATFQSIHRRLKEYPGPVKKHLERFPAVMVDEVHHVAADTFGGVMKELPNAYYRYGFSATPTREEDPETMFKVTGWIGETVSHMTQEQAVEDGHIVPADVFMVLLNGEDRGDQEDYQKTYHMNIVSNANRNDVVVDLAERMQKKGSVLILVERIEHGQRLRELLGGNIGRSVAFISGEESSAIRERALSDFRSGDLTMLIATNILDEGIDFDARTLILAGAGKAAHRTIQRVGRGTRTAEGKDRVMVFDFMDKGWRMREVNGKRVKHGGVLAVQANARLKTYQEQGSFSVCEIDQKELEELLG